MWTRVHRAFGRAGLITGAGLGLCLGLSGCVIVAVDGDIGESALSSSDRHGSHAIGVVLADVAPATAAQAGVDRSRACVVTEVWSNSAAERAGLKKYDVITHIDGKDWATVGAVRDAIRGRRAGESVQFSIARAGQRSEVAVVVPGE